MPQKPAPPPSPVGVFNQYGVSPYTMSMGSKVPVDPQGDLNRFLFMNSVPAAPEASPKSSSLMLRQYQRSSPTIQNAIPSDAGIAPMTGAIRGTNLKESIGRTLAPLVGLDYDAQQSLADQGINLGMIVSHGTPFDPESFAKGVDLSNARKGTGGLAQGHGWYLGENPAVPLDYKKNFEAERATWKLYHAETGETIPHPEGNYPLLEELANAHSGDKPAMHNYLLHDIDSIHHSMAIHEDNLPIQDELQKELNDKVSLQQLLAKPETQVGMIPGKAHILTADIPDEHIANMLDWDKPIKEQPDIIAKLNGKLPPNTQMFLNGSIRSEEGAGAWPRSLSQATGKDFYDQLASELRTKNSRAWNRTGPNAVDMETFGKKQASDFLSENGIPGNKYLDQLSRHMAPEWQLHTRGKIANLSPEAESLFKDLTDAGYRTREDMLRRVAGRATTVGKHPNIEDLPFVELKGYLKNPATTIHDASQSKATRNFVVFDPSIINEIQHHGASIYRKPGLGETSAHAPYHWADPQGASIKTYNPSTSEKRFKSTPFMVYDREGKLISAHKTLPEAQKVLGDYGLRLLQNRKP